MNDTPPCTRGPTSPESFAAKIAGTGRLPLPGELLVLGQAGHFGDRGPTRHLAAKKLGEISA